MGLKRRQADVETLDERAMTLPVCERRHSIAIACPLDAARKELAPSTQNPVKQWARRDRECAFHSLASPVAGCSKGHTAIGRLARHNTPDRIAWAPARPTPIDAMNIALTAI